MNTCSISSALSQIDTMYVKHNLENNIDSYRTFHISVACEVDNVAVFLVYSGTGHLPPLYLGLFDMNNVHQGWDIVNVLHDGLKLQRGQQNPAYFFVVNHQVGKVPSHILHVL